MGSTMEIFWRALNVMTYRPRERRGSNNCRRLIQEAPCDDDLEQRCKSFSR